jgi:predicted transcriptional regulator
LIHPKIKKLSENGLINLIDGNKNSKIPTLNYDEIIIAI